MKRLLLTALIAVATMHAGTVYVTAHGKTFHTNRQCMSLTKSSHVLTTDDKTAGSHGLHECGVCARRSSGKTRSSANTWATPEVSK